VTLPDTAANRITGKVKCKEFDISIMAKQKGDRFEWHLINS